ncbi:MAG: hypothetical protein IPJ49_21425 [Candidatus Obscuribacter sp.]|nr:hypothetical protein [Candidatus Obscuribacter sp.]
MRCISVAGGFQLGFELLAGQAGTLKLQVGSTIVATLDADSVEVMEKLGDASVESMVLGFTANKEKRQRSYQRVTIERAHATLVGSQIVLRPAQDRQCADFLVLMQSDHLRYPDSGFAALDGATVLLELPDYKAKVATILAKVPPGASLRAYIDSEVRGQSQRQYISNLALSPDGAQFISHG